MIDEPSPHPRVRGAVDSRPAAQTWPAPIAVDTVQPALVFDADAVGSFGTGAGPDSRGRPLPGVTGAVREPLGPPRAAGHRVHVVATGGPLALQPGLPDVRGWSASLALAMAEAVQGRRPVGQLSRWVDERVLATLTVAGRAARTGGASPGSGTADQAVRPPLLRSVRLQFPQPRVVEAAAHVQHGERSSALAFRLDAWYDRWLCTALELGPRPQP